MGPVLIFDKSLLESLNPDEAIWLDNFFLCNITPLFYIETLADLEKEIRTGRTAEDIVGNLAYKTPDASSKCNVHHLSLLAGELSGHGQVDMATGRPVISGGQTLELEGKTGIIFQQSPEEEAFQRWQKREFLDLERSQAKMWRKGLSNINLQMIYEDFQKFFPMGKPKTLDDIKKTVDFYINGSDQRAVLAFGLSLLGVPQHSQELVFARWVSVGQPSISKFVPYFTYIFSVDLFFNLAIAADLVGRGRASHKIDLAYLYYLPFCMVFTSNDKLHGEIVPFFLRDDQTFILGSQIKADLAQLDVHYSTLPDATKEKGVISFAFYPPLETKFLVTMLWDKYMSSHWREHQAAPEPQPDSARNQEIIEEIKRFKSEGQPVSDENQMNSDQANHIAIERRVYANKGKWKRFPPEVINRRKNEKGEWENIKQEG